MGNMKLLKLLLCFFLLFSLPVFAQEPKATHYRDWVAICLELQGRERCEIQQIINMDSDEASSRLLKASVSKIDSQMIMQLMLPLGLDLRPGIVMQIDDHEEFSTSFLTCVNEGCLAAVQLTAERQAAMRAGRAMKVGFRPFNSGQTLVLEISLMGFTRASETLN